MQQFKLHALWDIILSQKLILPLSLLLLASDGAASEFGTSHHSRIKDNANEKTIAAPRTVTLRFSQESIGGLYLVKVESRGQFSECNQIAIARDTVTAKIPFDKRLLLRCAGIVLRQPDLLNLIAPDDLDVLEICATPLEELETFKGKELLTSVARLRRLSGLTLKNFPAADFELRKLSNLKRLQHLTIELCEIDGSCLKSLATLPELYDMDLSFNQLKPENLQCIKEFRKLKRLILHDCKLNDVAITSIAECTNIENLALNQNAHLTDASMKSIASMKNLRVLDLKFTHITARGLRELSALNHLAYLAVSEELISPEQRIELKKRFPNTKIQYEKRASVVDSDTKRLFAPMPR